MEGDEGDGIIEDGVVWEGTRAELDAWKAYKRRKALAFVERGYSVSWYSDGDNWIEVYLPERTYARAPELRASVKLFGQPSSYGIDGGMVSKLTIQERRTDLIAKVLGKPFEQVRTLYNYDRSPDVGELSTHDEARRLYHVILEELN